MPKTSVGLQHEGIAPLIQRNAMGCRTVAVVYQFFAHYRGAVLMRLLQSQTHHYLLVGDVKDRTASGIKEWIVTDAARFIRTPCRFVRGRYLIQRGIIRLSLRPDIDVIIFLGDVQFLTTWIAAALARLSGKRVLFWTHGWTRSESGLKDAIRCAFYRLGHGLLLYGRRAKALAIQRGFRPENLYVLFNSLDHATQAVLREQVTHDDVIRIRQELFGNSHRPVVIHTGRLIRANRLDLLLQAAKELKQQNYPIHLLLVGDGPERVALETLATQYGLSVRFYGECYDEAQLASLIMAANVTVAPGKIGLTAMHSLVYGVPVISHDNPDNQMPEWEAIMPERNGAYFHENNAQDLARVIRAWTQTEFVSEDMRKQCFDIVDRFYTPEYQYSIIDRAVSGNPAVDD